MKKYIILILSILFFSSCAVNQNGLDKSKKEPINEELLSHVRYILYLMEINDLENLNNIYVNMRFGYFEINLDELQNKAIVTKKTKIEEIDNYIESFDIQNLEVNFNCSPYNDAFYGWSANGVFINEAKSTYLKDYNVGNNKDEIEFLNMLKDRSFEIVATNNTIFYLTKIDKRYYITVIDNFKTDCANTLLQAF